MKLTKVLFLFLASVSMLATSCSDDDDENTPGVTDDCVLTSATSTEDGVTFTSTLGYDNDRRISSVKMEGDDPIEGTVTYSNGKPAKFDAPVSPFGFPGFIEYVYNNAGQLSQMNGFVSLLPTSPVLRYAFEYNSAGQVTKSTTFLNTNPTSPSASLEQVEYSTFTYDANGNILKKMDYSGTGTGTLELTTDYTYDSNVNPINALEKLVSGYSTPNNILTAVVKDAEGNVLQGDSYSRVYKYNANNYPTEYTETTQNGVVTTYKASYNCK
ncbi:hypothetical protein GU926_06595 [Nibribacter ruber]|uniref:YD repeat-containing protein n=1 Tax=Nibribacter ruber TaxID=2698458 RepID=A0A6P1NXP9_9BACT|nr:hypothetical protein [Nibribacter ruber]QHL87114.1 hypothetical protein GU926_06595 [Nibribacter ruber]